MYAVIKTGGKQYRVASGDKIVILAYVMHHSPRYWDDPEKFDPERFAPERS